MQDVKPFSYFERILAWRYLSSRGKESALSTIALLSFFGIILGVAVLILTMSVMNGFREEIVSRILGAKGHIILSAKKQTSFAPDPALLGGLAKVDDVKSVVPTVSQKVLAQDTASVLPPIAMRPSGTY
jgi:lipoprotein-releasing system permease protein